MNRPIRIAAAALVLSLVASLAPQQAEAQTVSACYTKKNGTMYRVGEPNTPADCTSTAHVKETWNMQGQPGAPGISGYTVVEVAVQVTSYAPQAFLVSCPAGSLPLGAGWLNQNSHGVNVISSYPHYSGGWGFLMEKTVELDIGVVLHVICAKVAA